MIHFKPILIIEDDEASAYYLEEVVAEMGAKTIIASTAEEAIKIVGEQEVSLILMDIRLPDMDGYELTRYFRGNGVTTPIVAQTAFVMADDRQKALNAGCNDYMGKPIQKDILSNMIQKYLDSPVSVPLKNQ